MGFARLFIVAILMLITVLVGAYSFKVLGDESGEVNISPGPDSVLENNQKLRHIEKKEIKKNLKYKVL